MLNKDVTIISTLVAYTFLSPAWMQYPQGHSLEPATKEGPHCHSPQTYQLLLCKWHPPLVAAGY